MEFIRELADRDIGEEGLSRSEEVRYRLRRASRAIVFDNTRKIAMLDVTKMGYHKLPGGGLETGEDVIAALYREVKEEVGVEIQITGELGVMIECREQHQFMQISYCYIAVAAGEAERPDFTQEELEEGFHLQWLNLDEAIRLMECENPNDYVGKFILKRDLLFLKTMKGKLEAANGQAKGIR